MSILIGGGTGFIGSNLVKFLRNKGKSVTVISRKANGENILSWDDIRNNGLPDNCETVVNLAGRNIGEINPLYRVTNQYYSDFKADLIASRITTNEILTNAIKLSTNPPKLFISGSGIGYYKPSETETYTEDSVYKEHSAITELCKFWENSAKLPDNNQVRQIQMRMGLVLDNSYGILPIFTLMGLYGTKKVGSGKQWMSWIDVTDCIRLFDWAMDNETVNGPINMTAPNPVTNGEFMTIWKKVMGVRFSTISVPGTFFSILLNDRDELVLEGQKVLPKKALDGGFKFQYENLKDSLKTKDYKKCVSGVI